MASEHHGGRSRINGRYRCVFTDTETGQSWNATWSFTGTRGRLVGTAVANGDSSSFDAAVRGNRLLMSFSNGDADEYEIVGNGIHGYGDRQCARAKVTCTHRW